MTDTQKKLEELLKHCYIEGYQGESLITREMMNMHEWLDPIMKVIAEEKQLSYNEGVEDARLAVCSVEKNIWEEYVYLRIDKIFELLKELIKKE